jgi:hypothetical protein
LPFRLIIRVASARGAQGLDVVQCSARPVLFDLEVVAGLQVYPEPFRGAEVAGEPQGRVGADQDGSQARWPKLRVAVIRGTHCPALRFRVIYPHKDVDGLKGLVHSSCQVIPD